MTVERTGFVAECFWPDVEDADLAALDLRIAHAVTGLTAERAVRYLGSILIREDEVVLCRFEGTADAVREAATRARIPFERILSAGQSPWPAHRPCPRPGEKNS